MQRKGNEMPKKLVAMRVVLGFRRLNTERLFKSCGIQIELLELSRDHSAFSSKQTCHSATVGVVGLGLELGQMGVDFGEQYGCNGGEVREVSGEKEKNLQQAEKMSWKKKKK